MFIMIILFLLLRANKSNPSWFLFATIHSCVCVCGCVFSFPLSYILYWITLSLILKISLYKSFPPAHHRERKKAQRVRQSGQACPGEERSSPRLLFSAARQGQVPTEQSIRVKWKAEGKTRIWVGCTDGNFLGIRRKKRRIHTKLRIVLARATCVTQKLAKDDGFAWINCIREWPSAPVILKCLSYKAPGQIFSYRTDELRVNEDIIYPPVTKVNSDTFGIIKMQPDILSPSHFSMCYHLQGWTFSSYKANSTAELALLAGNRAIP